MMRIEMCRANAHGVGAVDLCAQFEFGFVRIDVRGGRPVMMEIAVFIEQAANFVRGSYRTPAIVNALAGESEMKAEIDFGMRSGVVRNFREPRAGHHDAG